MSTMKAIVVKNGKGDADSLYISDSEPIPGPPAAGQAVVKITAFALNRMDVLQREGNYPLPPHAPSTLGVEFAGFVSALGPSETSSFAVGDAVFGLAVGGAYAEYIICDTRLLTKYPSDVPDNKLSFLAAAGVPEVWYTATQALLYIAEIHKNKENVKNVLIHAGASGVGLAALQIARSILGPEAKIFATVGSDKKVQALQEIVRCTPINYNKQSFVDEVLKATDNKGADVIVDFIGPAYFQKNLDVAAVDGRIVLLSLMSGVISDKINIGTMLRKRLRIEGSTLRSRSVPYQTELKKLFEEYCLPKLLSGEFVNRIDKVYNYTEIVEAHKYMESNASMGKIVCIVDDTMP
ncbi:hypothetical protein BZA70DRAFT_278379 [Myxozyma melibiosi]|uniref:Enoyl reductase (ER) domain-containing protein n=1 Tax=Myxozyma melibiosi TaxID=54550 RepID=A0ABR1F6S9_9ASCO